MKKLLGPMFLCFAISSSYAQQTSKALVKKATFTDDNGQRIAFELPQTWKFDGSVILSDNGKKVGEFMPGTVADCKYQSGAEYLKELRVGYPDDMGSPRFVGSRTLVIGKTTWTEGVRNVPAWDGKSNTGRWYAHSFFALLNKHCFVINFYSPQRQLPEEAKMENILASIKIL
ncbi:hypothetical protein GKZ68_09285 [Hymenobacter sp. BRD128]|uniref:hypothetical protein n=1 Tax=Hymenobacter sp. BRD128 TaxID=2675878 RepID=UPI0015645265|nr:hypothetical protein [Hymenobacter sp. BRD128]QKG56796.1 hypothetical protein GKZ68_09285 [Hymenobacter sp. BRD128]